MTVTATEGDMFIGQFILFWQFNELCRQAYSEMADGNTQGFPKKGVALLLSIN